MIVLLRASADKLQDKEVLNVENVEKTSNDCDERPFSNRPPSSVRVAPTQQGLQRHPSSQLQQKSMLKKEIVALKWQKNQVLGEKVPSMKLIKFKKN